MISIMHRSRKKNTIKCFDVGLISCTKGIGYINIDRTRQTTLLGIAISSVIAYIQVLIIL